jgi:hypothetical protein
MNFEKIPKNFFFCGQLDSRYTEADMKYTEATLKFMELNTQA